MPLAWAIAGVADFNGDGKADILWRDTAGDVAIWLMNGHSANGYGIVANVSPVWTITGTGDFDGDGKADILWRDIAGNASIWLMNGLTVTSHNGTGMRRCRGQPPGSQTSAATEWPTFYGATMQGILQSG